MMIKMHERDQARSAVGGPRSDDGGGSADTPVYFPSLDELEPHDEINEIPEEWLRP